MELYYVNGKAQKTGTHEVHKLGCEYFPINTIYLGPSSGYLDALARARQYFPDVEPCPHCCAPRSKTVFFNPS